MPFVSNINFLLRMKHKIKIALVMIVALIIARLASNEVFISGSPQIRHNLGQYLAFRITSLFPSKSQTDQKALADYYNQTVKELEKVPLTQMAKGVYAKTNGTKSIRYFYLDQIPMKEYTFEINGKEYKVHVPVESNITEEQVKQNLENSPM